MASSHAHHAHPHRYAPHPNTHSNSNTHPSHVPSSDFRLPPLKSLNFQYRSPQQHDAPTTQDQSSYAPFDVSQDVNASAQSHAPAAPSAPATNGTSFSAFGYPTPTPTSATSAPAYVHRQPFAFQNQASSQSHDHDTWQQPHPPASAHSQTPSQMHAQVPSSQTSFTRSTPLMPTTVDPPNTAPARASPAFPAPPPKHRSTYPPPSSYTSNASHSYSPSYPPSSTSTSAPYTPYNTSPGYTANSTSPTFSPSTSPSYASASANTSTSYPSHSAYPTPTSAYPHPPPSPTPTPTQPTQPHPHAHSSPHYVPPPTSAAAYAFEDTRSSTTYESQPPPVRGHPQVQDPRDSRVPIQDRARYTHAQPKLADARIDSRHEMYPQPSAPTSVPTPAAVDARHSQSYSQHEARPGYLHQPDSSRPGTSYSQGQPPPHVPSQTQSEVTRTYPPEPRAGAYTQNTKYTYPQSHAPEPSTRAAAGYVQDPPTRVGYPPEGPTRHPHAHESRTGYTHGQESHGSNRGTGAPYVPETRQSSGYVPTQDTRHGYGTSDVSAVPPSFVPTEQRHGPPAPQYLPSNADHRSSFGDSRSAGAYPGNSEPSRGGYTAPDSVSVPAIVPLPRPPPPPPPPSQHHTPRQNGQPHGYSSLSPYPPQHTAPNYAGSPASASTAPRHSQSHSYIPQQQPAPHPSHSSHVSQPSHSHPPSQAVHSAHPTQTQPQPSHSLPHSQAQQQMHHPEPPRPAYVSPADTMHARETRFSMTTIAEQERQREQREREREREREEREREKELEREREREKRERESQREREKERERLAELREKEQRERQRDREREGVMHEVLKHCTVLYNFATRYAELQSSTPLAQPSPEELAEMTHHAQEVVRLLESLRSPSSGKLANASTASSSLTPAPHSSITSSAFGDRTNSHAALTASCSSGAPIDLDTRAPKRPWEETQSTLPHVSQLHLSNSPATTGQAGGQTTAERSAAEKDMEIIRTKRALTTSLAAAAAAAGGTGSVSGAVGGAVGTGKNKYRKRSRATPPGKCHSCNIRETPEWRRGPDGARTLCNACGLHYAKLVRKRDKALATDGGSGAAMRIDMDMLRASTRAAESEKAARAAATANGANASGSSGSSSNENTDMDKMSVHTGSFQIVSMNMSVDGESGSGQGQQGPSKTQSRTQSQQAPPQPQPSQPSTTQLPPPTSASGTPHLHPHGMGSGQGHPLPSPHAQSNAHYSHSSGQTRTHGGPPPPPWAGKAYGQDLQHAQQSFIRTSHSVSSGASPPR